MSVKREDVLLEGELIHLSHGTFHKKRFLILTHGALFEYEDQRRLHLKHTYELTRRTTVTRIPHTPHFKLFLKGAQGLRSDTIHFAVDFNLGGSATRMCELWVKEIGKLIDELAKEEVWFVVPKNNMHEACGWFARG